MEGKKETVNIIYVSNDGYARHLAASLYSLLAHSRKIRDLDVWVLSSGMCPEYQKRLQAVAEKFGRTVQVRELGDLREKFPYDVDTRGFDISAMGRLFARRFCRRRWSGPCIWIAIPLCWEISGNCTGQIWGDAWQVW